ncbi:MAG: secondary thiamine-phosphate synthase enzyme YjbQ [candidate division WOR-3 bacterium]
MTINFFCEINIKSNRRNELIDITQHILNAVRKSGIKSGILIAYVPHTTAGITINENADPSVRVDIENFLTKLVPVSGSYHHIEGNADAHIKAVLVGNSINIIIENGQALLGTWQGVYFCEFDGPRNRKIYIKILGE